MRQMSRGRSMATATHGESKLDRDCGSKKSDVLQTLAISISAAIFAGLIRVCSSPVKR